MAWGIISTGVGAILLVAGVLALLSARVRTMLRAIPVANKLFNPMTWAVILIVVGFLAGGLGVVSSYVGLDTANIGGGNDGNLQQGVIGDMTVVMSSGISNDTATEDVIDDSDKFMTFYSADATIAESEYYWFNVTVGRSSISEDGAIKVTCSAPDQDVSASEDNLLLKSAGEVVLTYGANARDSGTHADDFTVVTYVDFAEGDGSQVVQVKAQHDESYHDAMTDLQDYYDIDCVFQPLDGGASQSTKTRVYADS